MIYWWDMVGFPHPFTGGYLPVSSYFQSWVCLWISKYTHFDCTVPHLATIFLNWFLFFKKWSMYIPISRIKCTVVNIHTYHIMYISIFKCSWKCSIHPSIYEYSFNQAVNSAPARPGSHLDRPEWLNTCGGVVNGQNCSVFCARGAALGAEWSGYFFWGCRFHPQKLGTTKTDIYTVLVN